MENLKLFKSKLEGSLIIESSKSLSHRYLIAAALSKGISKIENLLESIDTETTINILKNLGVKIYKKSGFYYVDSSEIVHTDKLLEANESGSSLRFIIPILWSFEKESKIFCSKGLSSRPMDVYNEIALKHGYEFIKRGNTFYVKGPLKPGSYEVDATVSSQFISGLLFALSTLREKSSIVVKGNIASKKYIDLTIDVLSEFGVSIVENESLYYINENQTYQSKDVIVEGDYSQAAFFIVGTLITNSKLVIKNLSKNSKQSDKMIIEIVKLAGGKLSVLDQEIIIDKNPNLRAFEVDLYDIPDLGPILMVLAARIDGVSKFLNTNRLLKKESNRLSAMLEILDQIGIKYFEKENELEIYGNSKIEIGKIEIDTKNDHRIAMSGAILGLVSNDYVVIKDYKVINKSYPKFFEDLSSIGGKVVYDK